MERFDLDESEIKQAIREYVARKKSVPVDRVGVALQAKRRGMFASHSADFTAPITITDKR